MMTSRVCIGTTLGLILVPATVVSAASITIRTTSAWDTGHNGEIIILNDETSPINGWSLSFRNGPDLTSAWNCSWVSEDGLNTFTDVGWNQSIAPGSTVTIGYGADGVLSENITDAEFNGTPVSIQYQGSDNDDPTGGDGADGGANDGSETDPGGNDGSETDPGGNDGTESNDGSDNDPVVQPTCPGDVDGDGTVAVDDLLAVLEAWGPCVGCATDFNGNDEVEVDDLLVILAAWGNCAVIEPSDKVIVGYYIEWGIYGRDYQPADMPLEKITHVNYAFANIDAEGRIAIGDPYAAVEKSYPGDSWDQPYRGTYNQLNNVLRAQYPHLKTLISVGGWTWSGRFSDVALTDESRNRFAASCVDFIRTYNFDGVDIDWEYPVCCGLSSNTYRPEDRENYTLLMKELRDQLTVAGQQDNRDYLLTIASAGGTDKLANYELAELASHLDWVNTMSYDFMGAWDLSLTGHHSGLFANPNNPSPSQNVRENYNGDSSVQVWINAGVPAEKIVMGVPFYGRAWGGVAGANNGLFQAGEQVSPGTWDDWSSGATGINDYTEIATLLENGDYLRFWDDEAKVPWAWSPTAYGGHFISYDDPESIQLKMDYINQQGLGGAMFWEVTADREAELLNVIHEALTD